MKACWKKAYSYWNTQTNVDRVRTMMTECSPSHSWDNSHLKDSAIARLLLEGRLPPDSTQASPVPVVSTHSNVPMDLSSKPHQIGPYYTHVKQEKDEVTREMTLEKSQSPESKAVLLKTIKQDMDLLKDAKLAEQPSYTGQVWKCRVCPFTAPSHVLLHSHYQLHQQLLLSQSSKPHQEWLATYQRSNDSQNYLPSPASEPQEVHEVKHSPAGLPVYQESSSTHYPIQQEITRSVRYTERQTYTQMSPQQGAYPLKHLLSRQQSLQSQHGDENQQHPASGLLRAIVQAVMPKSHDEKGNPGAEKHNSQTIYNAILSKHNGVSEQESKTSLPFTSFDHEQSSFPRIVIAKEEYTDTTKKLKGHSRKRKRLNSVTSSKFAHLEDEKFKNIEPVNIEHGLMNNGSDDIPSSEPFLNTGASRSTAGSPVLDVVTCDAETLDAASNVTFNQSHNIQDLPLERAGYHNMHASFPPPSYPSPEPVQITTLTPGSPHLQYPRYVRSFSGSGIFDSPPRVRRDSNVSPLSDSVTSEPSTHFESSSDAETHREYVSSYTSMYSTPPRDTKPQYYTVTPTPTPDSTKPVQNDQGVQCELIGSFEDEGQSHSINGFKRCNHCGIRFDDDVMFSIHMGLHSHTDPFVCNVCGTSCGNRYTFYTHIMRGHQHV